MDMLVNYGKGVVGRDSIDPNRHAIIMTTPDNGKTAALLGSQLTCAGLIVAHVEFPMLTRATRVIPKSARQRAAVLAITLFDVLVEKGF
jgi:hypothetical protein